MFNRPRLFVSHKQRDVISDNFLRHLQPKIDRQVQFKIDSEIIVGKNWDQEIAKEIRRCHGALIVITQAALESPEIQREAVLLAKRAKSVFGPKLFPIIVDGTPYDVVTQKLRSTRLDSFEFRNLSEAEDAAHDAASLIIPWSKLHFAWRVGVQLFLAVMFLAGVSWAWMEYERTLWIPRAWAGVVIPAGQYVQGAVPGDSYVKPDEFPRRTVKITRSFWMKSTHVTRSEWKNVFADDPSMFRRCGSNCPVTNINWWEALAWCDEVSARAGLPKCYDMAHCQGRPGNSNYICDSVVFRGLDCLGFRLPTEAEWEYATRADSDTIIYGGEFKVLGKNNAAGLDNIAWYGGNSGADYSGAKDCSGWQNMEHPANYCGPHPVGLKEPNAWRLYDMLGNAQVWVFDAYKGSYEPDDQVDPIYLGVGDEFYTRVLRGGAWDWDARFMRISNRTFERASRVSDETGFRPVRTLPHD
jgi:formylglycine-generating enzyme required for sulfatase activity